MDENEEFNESLGDIIIGHMKMCNILKWSGIEPTTENLDKHFPYRNVGCKGLVCPNCGSIRLWIVKRKKGDIFQNSCYGLTFKLVNHLLFVWKIQDSRKFLE